MPSLSVVVPATDRPATLPRCLDALRAAGADEVVVVDSPHRLPVCAARNSGAARGGGEIVVFVDADVEVHPDALDRIRAAFAADPGLTALFGSYDDAPSRGGPVAAFRNLLHHHVHQSSPGPAQTFWSGLGAVRRDTFLAAGGFDAARFPLPSVEDIDLGARLAAAGARIELDPAIQGTHLKAWTLRSMVVTDFARRGVPWVALQLRSGGHGSAALNLGWRHRVSALASLAAVLGVASRRPGVSVAAVGVLLGLNQAFYRLLARRRGPGEAVLGVGLHALHHLTAITSVPFGIAAHLRERRR
jgi:GT2 family glycosyltransferase